LSFWIQTYNILFVINSRIDSITTTIQYNIKDARH
jgi:hypothetical protein